MNLPLNFGIEAYRKTVKTLAPQIDFGPDGESQDEPWTDTPRFRNWLEKLELGKSNIDSLLDIVPPVSLAMNHGPLFGIESFIEANSEERHNILEAGFLIFATGPNGDFIVVDFVEGNGRAGWLPMAMIWDMSATDIRNHFIPTNTTLGDFIHCSEEDWSSVAKDWYDAKDKTTKTKAENKSQ